MIEITKKYMIEPGKVPFIISLATDRKGVNGLASINFRKIPCSGTSYNTGVINIRKFSPIPVILPISLYNIPKGVRNNPIAVPNIIALIISRGKKIKQKLGSIPKRKIKNTNRIILANEVKRVLYIPETINASFGKLILESKLLEAFVLDKGELIDSLIIDQIRVPENAYNG